MLQGFALSPSQRHWLSERQAANGGAVNLRVAFNVQGVLDVDALADALAAQIERHEILRTRLVRREGSEIGVQVITEPYRPDIRYGAVHTSFVRSTADVERMTLTLNRFANGSSLLEIAVPGGALDSSSLLMCLEAACSDKPDTAGSSRFQFADLAEWQNQLLASEEGSTARVAWKQILAAEAPSPVTGLERRDAADAFAPACIRVAMSGPVGPMPWEEQAAAPRSDPLLACWVATLWRLTRAQTLDLAVGSDGRSHPDVASELGFFAKSLPLRVAVTDSTTLSDLAAQLGGSVSEAIARQDYLSWPDPEARAGRFAFGFETIEAPLPLHFGSAILRHERVWSIGERFRLKPLVVRTNTGLQVDLLYDAAWFDRIAARTIARQFATIVRAAVDAPNAPLADLADLHPREARRLGGALARASRRAHSFTQIAQAVFQRAATEPAAIAVQRADGSSLSYRALAERALLLAERLADAGCRRGDVVVHFGEPGDAWLVGALAVWHVGGTVLPLSPALPVRLAEQIIPEAAVRIALVDTQAPPCLHGSDIVSLALEGQAESTQPRHPVEIADIRPDDVAIVLYTSGSTGAPKGVMVEHGALVNYLSWFNRVNPSALELPWLTPPTFDAFFKQALAPLLRGASVVLAPERHLQEPARLADFLEGRRNIALNMPPTVLSALVEQWRQDGALESLAHVRRLYVGGETLTAGQIAQFSAAFPAAQIWNLYGPTEATANASADQVRSDEPPTIGRAIDNVRMYVLDDRQRPVPAGVVGDIHIAGAGLAAGYLGRRGQTALAFQPDPYGAEAGARMYKSGDRGRFLPDGRIEFLGRGDRQVKILGVRIEPAAVEAALVSHASVASAAVIARSRAQVTSLHAFVTPRPGAHPEPTVLRDHIRTVLGAQNAPATVHAVERFPLNAHGKIDNDALCALLDRPSTADSAPAAEAQEAQVAALLGAVLGRAPLGADEDFFAVGGHSLHAMQVIARIEKAFGASLPLRAVFEAPTPRALAKRLTDRMEDIVVPQQELYRGLAHGDRGPLSSAQRRLWLAQQIAPDTRAYLLPSEVLLSGPLDLDLLNATFAELSRRHEVLRTAIRDGDAEPYQAVVPPGAVNIPITDLSSLAGAEKSRRMTELRDAAARCEIDLTRGQPFEVSLVRLSEQEHMLLLALHHITTDALSNLLLFRQFAEIYGALRSGETPSSDDAGVRYLDYAAWEAGREGERRREAAWDYWRRQLAGTPPAIALPHRAQARRGGGAGRHMRHLGADAQANVRDFARAQDATVFHVALAAWSQTLRQAGAGEEIVIGSDFSGRTHPATHETVGFFANQLPLRIDMRDSPGMQDLVRRARDTTRAAQAHEALSFDELVTRLNPPRRADGQALFQVKLVMLPDRKREIRAGEIDMRIEPIPVVSSKLDMTLFVTERMDGLDCLLEYDAGLFEEDVAGRLLDGFTKTLVEGFAPEASVHRGLDRSGAAPSGSGKAQDRRARLKAIRSAGAKKIGGAPMVEVSPPPDGVAQPATIEARAAGVDIHAWTQANHDRLLGLLCRHGALRWRGFNITEPESFERLIAPFCDGLFEENVEHPRDTGQKRVYTPIPYPTDRTLLWHNENSFNAEWPLRIAFCCDRPADQGGESTLADSRAIWHALDPEIRQRFVDRGVTYVRVFGGGLGLDWRTVFQSDVQAEVEARCRAADIEYEWLDEDRLRTFSTRPAIMRHPMTGEMCWFNQVQHWHPYCLDSEARAAIEAVYDPQERPRDCRFSDGSEIPDEMVEEILKVYQDNEAVVPWTSGDVLLLDNALMAHGRRPYSGPRRHLVVLGSMTSFDSAQAASDPSVKLAERTT